MLNQQQVLENALSQLDFRNDYSYKKHKKKGVVGKAVKKVIMTIAKYLAKLIGMIFLMKLVLMNSPLLITMIFKLITTILLA